MRAEIAALKMLIAQLSLGEGEQNALLDHLKWIEKAGDKLEFRLDRTRKEKQVQFQLLSKTSDDLRAALAEMEARVQERTESLQRRSVQLAAAAEVASSIAVLRDPNDLLPFV